MWTHPLRRRTTIHFVPSTSRLQKWTWLGGVDEVGVIRVSACSFLFVHFFVWFVCNVHAGCLTHLFTHTHTHSVQSKAK